MKLRARMSLLTLLLFMAIAALSVSMWKLGLEVLPLQEEVRQLRSEVGKLTIDDPSKIYAMPLDSPDSNVWRWRIYLPPNLKFQIHDGFGTIPGFKPPTTRSQWLKSLGIDMSRTISSIDSGEFTLETSLKDSPESKDFWTLRTRSPGRNSLGGSVGTTIEWLSDERAWSRGSELQTGMQKEIDPKNGVVLLMLRKVIVTEQPNGYSSKAPDTQEDYPGVAVWITSAK